LETRRRPRPRRLSGRGSSGMSGSTHLPQMPVSRIERRALPLAGVRSTPPRSSTRGFTADRPATMSAVASSERRRSPNTAVGVAVIAREPVEAGTDHQFPVEAGTIRRKRTRRRCPGGRPVRAAHGRRHDPVDGNDTIGRNGIRAESPAKIRIGTSPNYGLTGCHVHQRGGPLRRLCHPE